MSRTLSVRLSYVGVFVIAAVNLTGKPRLADGASIYDYNQVGTFTLPVDSNSYSPGTFYAGLPTGNLTLLDESQVSVETAVHSGNYVSTGNLPASFTPTYGPTFLTVNSAGIAAAGDGNGDIAVFTPATPALAQVFQISDDSDAAWFNTTQLAITNSNGVQFLNTSSGTPAKTVIDDIGGASAGIAFDAAGNLYTGDGFYEGNGADQTGLIKEFSKSSWQAALSSGTPLDFESQGTPIAQLLSAASLGFDSSGNFFVGGDDSFGSGGYGFNALVSASAVQAAIASPQTTPPIDDNSPADVLREFDSSATEAENDDPGYWTYNDATGDLDLRYYGENTVYEYSSVPEPTCLALMTTTGALGVRRRRRAR